MSNLDDRLSRLENVFDAIATAWTGSAPTDPGTGVDTSTPFIRKLMAFAVGLEPDEQKDLAVLLAAAAAAGKQAADSPKNDQQRAASAFLKALDVKLAASGGVDMNTEIGPTITTVTVVTVLASHRWITCS